MRDVYPQKKRGLRIALILGLLVLACMCFKQVFALMVVLAVTAVSLTPLVVMIGLVIWACGVISGAIKGNPNKTKGGKQ